MQLSPWVSVGKNNREHKYVTRDLFFKAEISRKGLLRRKGFLCVQLSLPQGSTKNA